MVDGLMTWKRWKRSKVTNKEDVLSYECYGHGRDPNTMEGKNV